MIDIKRCPFCGGEAEAVLVNTTWLLSKYRGRFVSVGCKKCKVCTPMIPANNHTRSPLLNDAHLEQAKEKAVSIWNKRVFVSNEEKGEEVGQTADFSPIKHEDLFSDLTPEEKAYNKLIGKIEAAILEYRSSIIG